MFRLAGINVAVEHVWTEASGAKALWPRNLRLSKASLDAAGFERLSEWEVSLAGFCGKDVLM